MATVSPRVVPRYTSMRLIALGNKALAQCEHGASRLHAIAEGQGNVVARESSLGEAGRRSRGIKTKI